MLRRLLLQQHRKMSSSSSSSTQPHLTLPSGAAHPYLLYGTAWKNEQTTALVLEALNAGFRGIDTACQPRHYREDLVGAALKQCSIPREQLYIQTKFTAVDGQDAATCPYPTRAPIETQVEASVGTSLRNLGLGGPGGYIDTVLLHSPLESKSATLRAWRVLEGSVDSGVIRHLGISNVTIPELTELYAAADVKPAVVQNRFYPGNHWDHLVRDWCRDHAMVWQSFWTLTGNPALLKSNPVEAVAEKVLGDPGKREEALYLLVMALGRGWKGGGGVAILDGTTRVEAMREDLKLPEKLGLVTDEMLADFKRLIGEPEH
ncbi:NADP-dependent oxidoreductase domain-containing protein [Sphaerosporella brunnea]|uniref:NADP-dependent oxidoreductase domain-containing protein n=1 Tax=Sphaerosporella brunnea TaxID=1250544 RepID=A0A5J5EU60_9PEZI|nr:NADP-dependent oxidoreductase domain-containing protein [Sphaerosporella brunnea]